MNRILKNKNNRQTKDLKAIANKLFEKVTTLFSLKYSKLLNMNYTDYHKVEMEGKYMHIVKFFFLNYFLNQ